MRGATPPASLELPPDIQARLSAVAANIGQSEAWVIEQALEGYLALQATQLGAIAAGIAAADAGQVVPHDAVLAWVNSWDTADERPTPT